MTHVDRRVFGSIAWMMVVACGAPEPGAPADVVQNKSAVATDQANAQVERRSGETPRTPAAEQTDISRPSAAPSVVPPGTPSPPPPPPRREIRPSPEQAPAEVDPPHRYPGDEVPR